MPLLKNAGGWLALLLLGWLLYLLHPVLSPFLVGILLAYMGDPLVDRLERRGLGRSWAVILVFVAFSLLVLLALLVLVPLLGRQMGRLYQLLPELIDWLQLSALPWLQAQLGLEEGFWRFEQLKGSLAGQLDGVDADVDEDPDLPSHEEDEGVGTDLEQGSVSGGDDDLAPSVGFDPDARAYGLGAEHGVRHVGDRDDLAGAGGEDLHHMLLRMSM